MKQINLLLIAAVLLSVQMTSCGWSESKQVVSEVIPDDSAQLRLAVMPTLDCLPIYVAEEWGFFDREGIDVSLFPYQAQMDCDTAIERGRVNAMVTDLVRTEVLRKRGFDLHEVTSTELSWQLLTGKQTRIKQLKQLDDKMMAMTRFSATHLLSDMLVDSVKLQPERVFRIQVNDLRVRQSMLEANIMDALLMPEPWATAARNHQATLLFDTHEKDMRLGVIVFNNRAATTKQLNAFRKAYNTACDTINDEGLKSFKALICKRCGISEQTFDSLPDMKFAHAELPRPSDKAHVEKWLEGQDYLKNE